MLNAIQTQLLRWKTYKRELKGRSYPKFFVLDLLETISVALIVALLIRQFFFQTSYVYSGSMIPTLEISDRLIVNKMAFWFRDPVAGEIVLFDSPHHDGKEFVKRLIAGPGDTVEVKSGQVYRNGNPVYFPGVMILQDLSTYGPVTLPDHQYFVMGDNRGNSSDSRVWGFVDRSEFIGKAWFTFWPLSESEILK